MASKAFSSPLVRHVASRGLAHAAPSLAAEAKIQTNVLPNKIIVASWDNGSPVSRVTVAFKAGSRYEPQTDLGLSHVLRSAAGLTTQKASDYIIARKLAQAGGSLSVSGDREFIYYTLEAARDNIPAAVEQMNNLISGQEFRPWEMEDNVPRLKQDLATVPPQVRAVDLLHKAAFRRGLGNSLYMPKKKIGKVSTESMQHFAANTLTPQRCAVVVVGDSHERANLVAQNLFLCSGDAKAEPSPYHGGELRKEMGGDLAHVALALQGAPVGTPQSLALAVAAKAFGNGPVTKWGCDNTALGKAIGNIGPYAAAGFQVAYSDNGLIGAVLSVPKDEACGAVRAVAEVLRGCKLTDQAIIAGKNQLKLQVLSELDDGTSLGESMAAHYLSTGGVLSPTELATMIDQVNPNDVRSVMSSAASSKFSMGAAGNLAFVPFTDEL